MVVRNFHWQNNYAFQSDPDLRSLEVLGGANIVLTARATVWYGLLKIVEP
jgi:hypothetical protein